MTLNGIMALILRYFPEFGIFQAAVRIKVVEGVVVKSSRSLSHLISCPLQGSNRVASPTP